MRLYLYIFFRNSSPQNLKIGDVKGLKNSAFNASNPLKMIIHGYTSSIKEEIFTVNKNGKYIYSVYSKFIYILGMNNCICNICNNNTFF